MDLSNLPITKKDVKEAQRAMAGKVYNTQLSKSNYLSEKCNGEIYIKYENMQRTGSFKMRGAFNKLSSLTPDEAKKGVVACSAGNHAQGVALSGRMLGISTKIVMPETAPKAKIDATIGYGAEVVLFGQSFNETRQKVKEIVEEEGRVFVPPYDDEKVIAGQGTIGLEILESLWDVDNVVVPIGGGGLIAGIAVALKSFNPSIKVFGVQSDNVHGMAASLKAGAVVSHRECATIADGCDVATPGNLPFEIVKELVDEVVTVSEEDIKYAMVKLVQRNKIITEGAGCLATAGILSGKIGAKYIEGKKTVVIISGGNIDLSKLASILNA